MSGKCKGCGANIEWIVTGNGKRMPVDRAPYLTIVTDDGEVKRGRASHFATCKFADKFRGKGANNAGNRV
ncbi:MAG: hypothetical protein IBX64_11890 [Actinobacteria bacterium]|nr:hypothetical protein [Actinomycetota bacterium]